METGPFTSWAGLSTNCQLFGSIWARESRSSNNCHWASQLPLLTANLQLNWGNLHLLRFGLMRFPINCSASVISQVTARFFGSCTTLSRWYQENGVLLYVKTGCCWVYTVFLLWWRSLSVLRYAGVVWDLQCCSVLCCFQIQEPLPVPLLLMCCPSNWCKKNWYVVYYYL